MEARANATQLIERNRAGASNLAKLDCYSAIGPIEVGHERCVIDAGVCSVRAPNCGRAALGNELYCSEAHDSCDGARSVYPQARAGGDKRHAPTQFNSLGSRKDCVGIRGAYGNECINRGAHVAIQAPRLRQTIRSLRQSPSGS
jgi:hypothetical protein